MEDGVLRAAHRLDAARDQLLAALAENLDRDIIGDAFLLDEAAAEIEFDLRRTGETDLDFLETDADEHVEILEFFLDAHGLGEGLVAVAEIDAAPDGRVGEGAVGPLALRQIHRRKGPVFRDRSGLHDRKNRLTKM